MSSVLEQGENATELRLDYEEIAAGRLVIVIRGLPAAGGSPASSSGRPQRAPLPGSNGDVWNGCCLSPPIEQAEVINEAAARAPVLVKSLVLAAWRGQETRTSELIAALIEGVSAEAEPRATAVADYARAVLYNGLGRYQEAAAFAESACFCEDVASFDWALLELVEAGARCDARALAARGLSQLDRRAGVRGTAWALGIRARSAALLDDCERAECLYREAIELLDQSGDAAHLARARLVYGEWLRRRHRRIDARAQLRSAHDTFSEIEAEAFAARAFRELLATGETARRRADETRAQLTPQEAEIARLARDGLSNPQIGAQLFVSPRTVQYHLRKVFQKLDISSRNQLGRVPPDRLDLAA